MAKVTVEDLKQRFLVRDVAPHGSCVMVPGDEFDPDWEACLDDLGYSVVFQDFDRKPFAIVPLKRAGEGEKVVFVPPPGEKVAKVDKVDEGEEGEKVEKVPESPRERAGLERVLKGKDTPLGPRWTEDEYELLMKLWKQKKKVRVIAAEFPKRSGHAVTCAIARLKNSGLIKPRWVCKGSKREIPDVDKNRVYVAAPAGVKPPTPGASVPKSVDTPASTVEPYPVCFKTCAVVKKLMPMHIEKRGRPSVPSISVNVNVDVHCDCSNKESVENLKELLKELRA
jgi:hypothetical protein